MTMIRLTIDWKASPQFHGVFEAHGLPRWRVRGWNHRWLMWIETRPAH
jgi:hypothetical protein